MTNRAPKTVENTRTLASQVVSRLVSSIMAGEYGPGSRLLETELAAQYGVSRHVVREAFHALEARGLVVNHPFRGRSVIGQGPEDLEGYVILRVSLESTAAALAAYKMTEEQSRHLFADSGLVDRGPRDYKDLIQCEVDVHRSIWELAGDPLLTEQLERVLLPFMLTLLKVVHPQGDAEEAFRLQMSRERDGHPAAHGVLLERICTRDPERARQAMLAHLLWSRKHNWSRQTIDAVHAAFPETKNLDALAGEPGPFE